MIQKRYAVGFILIGLVFCVSAQQGKYQKTVFLEYQPQKDSTGLHYGIDLLAEHDFEFLKNKKIAVVCNDGSLTRTGEHLLDVVNNRTDFQLVSVIQVSSELYRVDTPGKALILADKLQFVTSVVLSPHNSEIELSDINNADLILLDLQNLGIRTDFNLHVLITFMDLSADVGVPLLILDRPNLLTANITEGPCANFGKLNEDAKLPWRYGMTVGELAFMINEERWLPTIGQTPLTIIPMVHYDRTIWIDQTDYAWQVPLKGIYSIDKLLGYCSTFFYDYTNVSNGRGNPVFFEVAGAPWISGSIITMMLNRHDREMVEYDLVQFTPVEFSGAATNDMDYIGEKCTGIRFHILKQDQYNSIAVGSYLLGVIAQMYPQHFEWKNKEEIDRLFGDDSFRTIVDAGLDLNQLYPVWLSELTNYQKLRRKYFFYPNR